MGRRDNATRNIAALQVELAAERRERQQECARLDGMVTELMAKDPGRQGPWP
ncbi:hypothetical protein KIPB_014398, partial [Kipferlia bialata]|eukprot:g14398.t1